MTKLIVLRFKFYYIFILFLEAYLNHEEIANNNLNFSKFEKEIMELICNGYKNKEISKLLELALSVLEEIISEIYKKLGAKNRANAVYLICKYKIL